MIVRTISHNADGSVKHVIEHKIKDLYSKTLAWDIDLQAAFTDYKNENQGEWKIITLQIRDDPQ